ncbi:actin family protein [Streptomyces sp. NPDC001581]|uniref:actin family protein n=1 Tax=Streptomyces sp. NPDC001581 TaxID=3154386 RepID=UPI00332143FA
MSNVEKPKVLVVDLGSGWIKAGFAGDDAPAAVVPNVIGKPKSGAAGDGYVGAEAVAKGDTVTLHYPVQHGVVTDWAALERVLAHTFREELRVKPSEHSVLLAHVPGADRGQLEKLLGLLFDRFEVRAAKLVPTGLLALRASGRTTGLVVDIGDDVTSVSPVYEGKVIEKAVFRSDLVTGRSVTHVMRKRLAVEGYTMTSSAPDEVVRDLKEQISYAAKDFDEESQLPVDEVSAFYTLPDGNTINVGNARYEAAETLFKPSEYLGLESQADGLHELIKRAVDHSDLDLRTTLCSATVLAGGSSLLDGLEVRLSLELGRLLANSRVQVLAPEDRKHSAWRGGSALGNESTTSWINRSAYDEKGAAVLA